MWVWLKRELSKSCTNIKLYFGANYGAELTLCNYASSMHVGLY